MSSRTTPTSGFYSGEAGYFTNAGVDNAPLHALQDGIDGRNGVYRYGASGFPTETYQGANYWVDVVFETTVAPTRRRRSSASSRPRTASSAVSTTTA